MGLLRSTIQHLRKAAMPRESVADGQLLESFVARRDEASFEELVRRLGPMALGVCRRVLANGHDAEDAFQATFLVLVRKAASIRPRERVGPWLYGVAYRTALQARTAAAVRRTKERQTAKPDFHQENGFNDLLLLLDQELNRLPEKYRAPVVLCELEGKTHQEAARQLGWPVGTVSGRLSRARALLRRRLARRAPEPSAGALSAALAREGSAAVPAALTGSTVRALSAAAAAPVASLVNGALKAMFLSKLKTMGAALVGATMAMAMAVVVGAIAWQARAADPAPAVAGSKTPADPGKNAAKPSEDAVRGLKLTLSADKTETKLLPDGSNVEPIKLKLTFANSGRQPLTLDMSPAAWSVGTSITVKGPDGVAVRGEKVTDFSVIGLLRKSKAEDFHLLQPGDEWARTIDFPVSSDALSARFHLTKPGDYHIQAVHVTNHAVDDPLAKGSWNGTVKSEDFVLKVMPADDYGPVVRGLKARVLLAREKIPVGSPAQVKYCVKNVSKGELTLWHSGFWLNHQIIVHDADGKEPPLNAIGAAGRKAFSPGGDRDKNFKVKLAPGAEDDTEGAFDLTWVYDLSKPGHYTVQYIYEEKQGGWEGRLPSNEAAFEITTEEIIP